MFRVFYIGSLMSKIDIYISPCKLRLIFGEREKGGQNAYTHARFGEPALPRTRKDIHTRFLLFATLVASQRHLRQTG